MAINRPVQGFVAGTSTALILVALFLILIEWSFGQLNLWLLGTDLAVILLTVGVSILIANVLIAGVERRSQYDKAKIPMGRIARRTGTCVESIVHFLIATLNDDDFVRDLFGAAQPRLPGIVEFREKLLNRPNNPAIADLDDLQTVSNSVERNSLRLRNDTILVGSSLSLDLAIELDKQVGGLEVGLELLQGAAEAVPPQPPEFKDVVFALSQCYEALVGLTYVVRRYAAERPQSFFERWPTPEVLLIDVARRIRAYSSQQHPP